MACDAVTLEALLTSNGYEKLSDYDALVCLAYAFGNGAGYNAQQAVNAAAANGYSKLSDRDLDMALLKALCP